MSPEVRRRSPLSQRSASAQRLAIARRVTRELALDPNINAVIALGSLARRRCSHDSDIDLAIISDARAFEPRFESRRIDGITVDCDWMSRAAAWLTVQPQRRDLQSLRDAARLGQGLAILDRTQLVAELRRAATALLPDETDMREHIHGSFRTWCAVRQQFVGRPEHQWDALRAAFDSIVYVLLQLSPARYQKPKWVVDDLMRARLPHVAEALLATYSASRASRTLARHTIDSAEVFLNAVATAYGLPDYERMLALGRSEELAAFSYICRGIADARSLAADDRHREAQYVAKFGARMAVAYAAELDGEAAAGEGGMLPLLERMGHDELLQRYRTLFLIGATASAPDTSLLDLFIVALRRAYRRYRRAFGVQLRPAAGGAR